MADRVEGLVSTVIPVFNRADMLREAVASVLAQTYRPIEVIVSDDGSTDGAGAAADRLAAEHAGLVRVVHNPNRGAGPAREAGRILARGEFIQYLDSDDLLLPRKFEVQVRALRERPECGAAYGYIRLVERDGTVLDRPYKGSGAAIPYLFPRLLAERWWNTDCPLFRRTVTDAVGPWSDLRYSQDWEYDARVGALRTPLAHCAEYVCVQRQHGQPRQTGHGQWLDPVQRARFFSMLHEHAVRAGVPPGCVEMRHFSRWAFFHARDCGRMGFPREATRLWSLAAQAVGKPRLDLMAYRLLTRAAGWRWPGILSSGLTRALGRSPGRDTLRFQRSES